MGALNAPSHWATSSSRSLAPRGTAAGGVGLVRERARVGGPWIPVWLPCKTWSSPGETI